MSKSIADRMAEAAETDLGLPYSLMRDAWDLLGREDERTLRQAFAYDPQTAFVTALMIALDEYEADPLAYWTDERVARARGAASASDYDPADDGADPTCEACKRDGIACTAHEDAEFYADAAHRDGDHASCTHGVLPEHRANREAEAAAEEAIDA